MIPHTPSRFNGIECFYRNFEEVSDREVEATLQRWAARRPDQHPGVKTLVMRVVGDQHSVLHCELDLPPGTTRGSGPYPAVIFAHTRESDGHSPRTVPISRRLAKRNVVGVRMDFSGHGRSDGTLDEATDERMLADLRTVFDNVQMLQEVDPARIGINAAGTAGNIALRFAAEHPVVAAIVIRGPLSSKEIEITSEVKAPTYWLPRSEWWSKFSCGLLLSKAIVNARRVRYRSIRLLVAQPTTRRENRSRITARYSHPSRVQMKVMSPAQR